MQEIYSVAQRFRRHAVVVGYHRLMSPVVRIPSLTGRPLAGVSAATSFAAAGHQLDAAEAAAVRLGPARLPNADAAISNVEAKVATPV